MVNGRESPGRLSYGWNVVRQVNDAASLFAAECKTRTTESEERLSGRLKMND